MKKKNWREREHTELQTVDLYVLHRLVSNLKKVPNIF
jgi:hypothetical protein